MWSDGSEVGQKITKINIGIVYSPTVNAYSTTEIVCVFLDLRTCTK